MNPDPDDFPPYDDGPGWGFVIAVILSVGTLCAGAAVMLGAL